VRQLISPYILRRLKSDKSIIADLPDKTEVDTYCFLTKNQIGLYQQTVNELAKKLQEPAEQQDPMARSGLVLSYLMRLKQICNHPNQWLGHGDFDEQASGKFLRLKELCEGISAKQEKVLIFTQYREIIPALQTYLASIFGRSGLILHGGTPIKERAKLVESFQTEQGPPFFILSIKAGGTGLTLTNASHVIHFDRWWNPAVESQATDRAYRIGQKKNVLVHKFICQGTIEEKIDFMINQKKALANDLLQGGGESLLTEMSNEELMKVVSLDIHRAMQDE
jgi:non-specific serine/threonine protein kinase